ncbi:MAG: TolC family protein, partial [Lachnospiraceae bacterium]|nr:TolC family protein [Lachnospiraceae bacterium]
MKRNSLVYKCIALVTSVTLFTGLLGVYRPAVVRADQTMTLQTARALALQNSSKYESAEDTVNSKEAARESAIKSLKAKKKNMSTFRWTPLLNFKFPQKANFAQESEFQFKPIALQAEVWKAEHKKQDVVFDVNNSVNQLFTSIVTLQENISFNEKRVEALEEGLGRNKAKLKLGEANQSDIDRMQKKLDTTNDTIASDRRSLEADLKKLSKQINLDVSTGYTFEKPYVEAKIDRSSLPALIQYTEDRDEAYYEACIATTTARTQLATNYDILKNKYGGDMNIISSYVNQALNGQSVSSRAFKADYKRFLEQIDSYWDDTLFLWIPLFLVIIIPFEWLKGDLDGIRYIEDDPYTLYQNVLDYVSAAKDEESAREELDQQVEDQFNNYISVRNSYQS